jgi:CrcB protein
MHNVLLVGLGGGLGAMARYGAGFWVARLWPMGFPLGTMLINIVGSILMGIVIGALTRNGAIANEALRLFVAVGILGGFTTFSAFSLDAVSLIERGELLQAGGYVLISVAVCLIGLYLGLLVTRGVA